MSDTQFFGVRRGLLLAAVTFSVAGCWVLIDESFTGYRGGTDGDSSIHSLDDCMPTFAIANGIEYPTRSSGSRTIDAGTTAVHTNTASDCWDPGRPLPYCLIAVSNFTVKRDALFANGLEYGESRPLVIVSSGDIVIEEGGTINIGGGENGAYRGPGAHDHKGSASNLGGGGGNAEPGESGCNAAGGASLGLDAGLVGGGHGGGLLSHPNENCRRAGSGGGAIQLVSLCGQIVLRGKILASGGGGGVPAGGRAETECPEGQGGGAGGTVWFQSKDLIVSGDGAFVDLTGGGGGGGGCSADGATWISGKEGNRHVPGEGANCASSGGSGGYGGVGGSQSGPPRAGTAGTSGTGAAKCGGGGGGRGRLVVQTTHPTCSSFGGWHSGVCVDLAL